LLLRREIIRSILNDDSFYRYIFNKNKYEMFSTQKNVTIKHFYKVTNEPKALTYNPQWLKNNYYIFVINLT